VSTADERHLGAYNALFCREDLAGDIESILGGGPHAAEALARLFLAFKNAIDSGLEGINQTSRALLTGVELTYLHSPAHEASLRLYLLSQQGELTVEDEPVNLINAAINRNSGRLRSERQGRKTRRQ
jgi:hypothetical protein